MSNFAQTCFIYCSENFKKIFSNLKKFPKFYPIFTRCDATTFRQLFSKIENYKIDVIFSKIFFKTRQHSTIL